MPFVSFNSQVTITGRHSGPSSAPGQPLYFLPNERLAQAFTAGSGSLQAHELAGRTDTCSTSEASEAESLADYDLTDFPGPYGAVVFTSIRGLYVFNDGDVNILYGNNGNGTNGFVGPLNASASTYTIPPGGVMAFPCQDPGGWACTTGTHLLRLRAASGTCAYSIYLVGTT